VDRGAGQRDLELALAPDLLAEPARDLGVQLVGHAPPAVFDHHPPEVGVAQLIDQHPRGDPVGRVRVALQAREVERAGLRMDRLVERGQKVGAPAGDAQIDHLERVFELELLPRIGDGRPRQRGADHGPRRLHVGDVPRDLLGQGGLLRPHVDRGAEEDGDRVHHRREAERHHGRDVAFAYALDRHQQRDARGLVDVAVGSGHRDLGLPAGRRELPGL
jgi:hypothetical protein